jgi:hypothetical protein
MTAEIVKLQPTIDQMITELHKNFATEREAGNRADRARIRCGQLLLALRERIEAGEAGDVGWWDWYKANIARSRRDGERVMKIARDADPDAAAEAERAAARASMTKTRAASRDATNVCRKDDSDADPSERKAVGESVRPDEDDDRVERALGLVEQMTPNQRQRFFAALRSNYAYPH